MSVTVVVGGGYGSEAKAKAAIAIGQEAMRDGKAVVGVRCGGPNAGHTVYFNGKDKYVLRMIPAVSVIPSATLIICSGALVNVELLMREINEIEKLGVSIRNRLIVSGYAVAVDEEMVAQEKRHALGEKIGSTQTGTGSTAAARAMRRATLLKDYIDAPDYVSKGVDALLHNKVADKVGTEVIIEGTQGFGLDLLHSHFYPFVTSKSTTAASFIAEAGISPRVVDRICMVIRTYPIRVGGNSGPMEKEISWEEVARRCGATEPLIEMTSVTKKVRRVGEFDWDLFYRAVQANQPTDIAIHGLDYLNWRDRDETNPRSLSWESWAFMNKIMGIVPISMAFTGPTQRAIILDPMNSGAGLHKEVGK